MSEQVKKEDVITLIENYYSAPESSRKTLLDNIITAIRCMPESPARICAQVSVDVDEVIRRIKEDYDLGEEIIRCKHCKHHKKTMADTVPDWCSVYHTFAKEDGFCHKAERIENEDL